MLKKPICICKPGDNVMLWCIYFTAHVVTSLVLQLWVCYQ